MPDSNEISIESRLDREREFHNDRFTQETRDAQHKYYSAILDGQRYFHERVRALASCAECLEYGCGDRPLAIGLASCATSIVGVDISDVAVEACSSAAVSAGSTNSSFLMMNAESLEFEDNSFDLIFGSGIIHHLDVERSMAEVARTLKPGGSACFWEPLGDNPVWNAYRRRTPSARTPDEHPLTELHFRTIQRFFANVDVSRYGLATLAAVPFRDSRVFRPMHSTLRRIDRTLFRSGVGAKAAWFAMIELSDPKA